MEPTQIESRQHLTSRRGFIAAFGFGGVALYGAWAAYGAAPLPFTRTKGSHAPHVTRTRGGHAPHGAAPAKAPATPAGHGAAPLMTPDEFLRRHEAFLARFRKPEGHVVVSAAAAPADAHAGQGAPQPHAMHGAPTPPPAQSHAAQGAQPADDGPLDIYLHAFRFGFTPDELHLRAGQPYRFRMLASDVSHGASLQLGHASRIVRLRANVVSEQTITFHRSGRVLVYCTVFCGPAHDAMRGRIVVA